jgi:hypothetical protein
MMRKSILWAVAIAMAVAPVMAEAANNKPTSSTSKSAPAPKPTPMKVETPRPAPVIAPKPTTAPVKTEPLKPVGQPVTGFNAMSQRADQMKQAPVAATAQPEKPKTGFGAFSQNADTKYGTQGTGAKPAEKQQVRCAQGQVFQNGGCAPVKKPSVQEARATQQATASKLADKDRQIAEMKTKMDRQRTEIVKQQAANKNKKVELANNKAQIANLRQQRNAALSDSRYQRARANNAEYDAWASRRNNRVWVENNPAVWSYRPGYTYRRGNGHYGYGDSAYGPVVAPSVMSTFFTGAAGGVAGMMVANAMIPDPVHAQQITNQPAPPVVVAPYGTQVSRTPSGQIAVLVPDTNGQVVETILPPTATVEQISETEWQITNEEGQKMVITEDTNAFTPADGDEGAGMLEITEDNEAPSAPTPASIPAPAQNVTEWKIN